MLEQELEAGLEPEEVVVSGPERESEWALGLVSVLEQESALELVSVQG